MKRDKFIKYLKSNNCVLLREGSNHSIWTNIENGKQSSVGRHKELSDLLCDKICKQLEIPPITKK